LKKPEFVVNTEDVYKSFESEINKLRDVGALKNMEPRLEEIAISAYVKCYDFMIYICNLEKAEYAFFQLPFLRGMCEDLISISYLLTLNDHEIKSIILSKQVREFRSALGSQEKYFRKNNPVQPVVPKELIPDLSKYIDFYKEKGLKITKRYLPSVQKMSKKVGLEDFYNFLYFATSKTVHFDIVTLMSMGWGKMDKEKGTINPIFSYENNFHQYYKFVFFYTSRIFIEQTTKFKKIIDKNDVIILKLGSLIQSYKLIDWPTIITFEQMNIDRPKSNNNLLYRFMVNMDREGKFEEE